MAHARDGIETSMALRFGETPYAHFLGNRFASHLGEITHPLGYYAQI